MSVATVVRRLAMTGAVLAASATVAEAQPSAFDFLGTGGNVSVRYVGSNAGDQSTLSYKIGGGAFNIGAYTSLFTNGGVTPVGTQVSIGPVAAGTIVYFRLNNNTTGNVFYSGAASRNADNTLHVSLAAGSGTAAVGGGTYTTAFNFEDRFFPPSDLDYNDLNFEIANVSTVPEPGTYALMAAGLVGLAVIRRRRNA